MPSKIQIMTHLDARKLMNAALQSAQQHQVPGAIAIVDQGGHLILCERLDNTMNAAANIAIGKAATVVAFRRASSDLEDVILDGRSPMLVLDSATPCDYVPLKGGQPIWHDGQLLGAIAVAGTMDAEMDDVVAKEAIATKDW